MIERKYGKTNKELSIVGFGGMRFVKEEYTNQKDKCAEIVRYAHQKGVTYFDTAPTYCEGQSESIYGLAFEKMKREDFVVATKCSLFIAKNKQETLDIIKRSLDRMKLDKIDIMHSWCIQTMEEYAEIHKPNGIYEGILEAQARGYVDVVAFSTHMNGSDIKKVAGEEKYAGCLLGYNALNHKYREEGITALAAHNKGIVVMNPMGGGVIPQNPELVQHMKMKGDNEVLSSLKFLTSQERITSIICGISSFEEVDFNVQAGENLYTKEEQQSQRNKSIDNVNLDRICTFCGYCNLCPHGVNPHKLMFSYNQKILGKDNNMVMEKIKGHEIETSEAEKCISCGLCESACTQKLPIIERLKDIASM